MWDLPPPPPRSLSFGEPLIAHHLREARRSALELGRLGELFFPLVGGPRQPSSAFPHLAFISTFPASGLGRFHPSCSIPAPQKAPARIRWLLACLCHFTWPSSPKSQRKTEAIRSGGEGSEVSLGCSCCFGVILLSWPALTSLPLFVPGSDTKHTKSFTPTSR